MNPFKAKPSTRRDRIAARMVGDHKENRRKEEAERQIEQQREERIQQEFINSVLKETLTYGMDDHGNTVIDEPMGTFNVSEESRQKCIDWWKQLVTTIAPPDTVIMQTRYHHDEGFSPLKLMLERQSYEPVQIDPRFLITSIEEDERPQAKEGIDDARGRTPILECGCSACYRACEDRV